MPSTQCQPDAERHDIPLEALAIPTVIRVGLSAGAGNVGRPPAQLVDVFNCGDDGQVRRAAQVEVCAYVVRYERVDIAGCQVGGVGAPVNNAAHVGGGGNGPATYCAEVGDGGMWRGEKC